MWIVLLLALASFWLLSINLFYRDDHRLALVVALVLFQTYLVAMTEVLSLLQAVTPLALVTAWGAVVVGVGVWVWIWRRQGKAVIPPKCGWPQSIGLWIVDGIIVFILLVTLVIALAAPPNTADSLVYHMPRLAHWAQDRAVHHFPTGVEHYNSYPPGAEMQMLHFYLLFGGDRLVNLQGWFAFLGAILAAASLSRVIGLGETGAHFSALFVASMPLALAHASSSKNDLAVGFWVIGVVLMAFHFLRAGEARMDLIVLGLALGLGLLTKQSAALFLAPFGLWFVIRLFQQLTLRQFFLWALVLLALVVGLNGGYLIRNWITYQHPVDPVAMSQHRTEAFSLPVLLSNVARNLSSHAQTPWPWTRTWIYDRMIGFHEAIGVDPSDPRTTVNCDYEVPGFITSEVLSGNPLHMSLILVAFLGVGVFSLRRKATGPVLILSLTAAAAFVLFSLFFKWQCFSARYHFPFFFMTAPVVAFLFDRLDRRGWASALMGLAMLALGGLWLFSLRPRPIFPWRGMTQETSIFENRTRLYFPSDMMYETFMDLGPVITESGCEAIGVRLRGSSMEYLYWVALDMPRDSVRISWLVAGTPSAQYRDPDFKPCAVICEDCPQGQTQYDGLPLVWQTPFFDLFLTSPEMETQ